MKFYICMSIYLGSHEPDQVIEYFQYPEASLPHASSLSIALPNSNLYSQDDDICQGCMGLTCNAYISIHSEMHIFWSVLEC